MLATLTCQNCSIVDFLKSDLVLGFGIGFATAVILWLILKCFFALSKGKSSILLEDGQKGAFTVSIPAIESFVRAIAAKYDMMTVEKIKVFDTREGTAMDIHARFKNNVDVMAAREQFRNELFAELSSKLGIVDQIKEINIKLDSFIAQENDN